MRALRPKLASWKCPAMSTYVFQITHMHNILLLRCTGEQGQVLCVVRQVNVPASVLTYRTITAKVERFNLQIKRPWRRLDPIWPPCSPSVFIPLNFPPKQNIAMFIWTSFVTEAFLVTMNGFTWSQLNNKCQPYFDSPAVANIVSWSFDER